MTTIERESAPPGEMHLAVLVSAAGNHQGAWRRANSGIEGLHRPDFYVDFARKAERAKLDCIFFADIPVVDRANLAFDPPSHAMEPMVLNAYLAANTSRIGLALSVSTSFSEPYTVARQFATLDHLSAGRAGWNVVTSATGERNYGNQPLPDQATRYAQAREFVEITRRLWDSWDEDSVIRDRVSGRYIDVDDVTSTDFHGRFFDVDGPLNVQRPPQGWPVLFQAGASPEGSEFASEIGEAIFTAQQTLEGSLRYTLDLRGRIARRGRDPRRVKVLNGITPIIGATESDARAIERELGGYLHEPAALRRLNSYFPGVDLKALDPDRPIPREVLPAVSSVQGRQSRYALFVELTLERGWTLRELVRLAGRSDGHWTVVGSPEQIADQMAERFLAGAGDGYVVMPTYHPEGSGLFFEAVVPILQARGLFRREYRGVTLRDHLGLEVPARGRRGRASTG
jgi:FMN-dependent oxidoreductase (nitrilotriacetate monooxygenase family)